MRPVSINAKLLNAARFGWRSVSSRRLNIWIALGLSYAAMTSLGQQNPPSRGRDVTKLYTEYCASCHGADMAGGSGSSLVDGIWRHGGDGSSIAASIRNGHPEEGMPAMGRNFDGPEIRALVIYMRERAASVKTAHTKYNAPVP